MEENWEQTEIPLPPIPLPPIIRLGMFIEFKWFLIQYFLEILIKIYLNLYNFIAYQTLVEIKWKAKSPHLKSASKILQSASRAQTPKPRRMSPPPGETESALKTTNSWEMSSLSSMRTEVASSIPRKSSKYSRKSVSTREIPTLLKLSGQWGKQIRTSLLRNSLTSSAHKLDNTRPKTDSKEFGDFTTRRTMESSDSNS